MDFKNRIKQLRNEKRITQVNLAMELNLSQNAISKYEAGKTEPDIQNIKLLSGFFNVSSDYLLGLSDEKFCLPANNLSSDEKQLLFSYKRLDKTQKEIVQSYIKGLLQEL